jgi:hypothetical protein
VDTQFPTFSSGTSPSSNSLLAISEGKKSGLILCKEYTAEFAGPGAAVSSPVELPYKAVIAIGAPDLISLNTLEQRKRAYGRRIQWARWLQKIIDHAEPAVRAEKLLAGFEEFFGRHVVMSLPTEVLAQLAGVFPPTIDNVRYQHWDPRKVDTTLLFGSAQLKVTTISLDPTANGVNEAPLSTAATLNDIKQTYSVLRSA